MRLPWLVALALGGCLSPDVSTSDTEDDESTEGDESTGGTTTSATASSTTTSPSTTATSEPTSTTTTDPTTGEPLTSDCLDDALRVATLNVQTVGSAGSGEFDALAAILMRIGADVICLQEITTEFDVIDGTVDALAAAADYEHVVVADQSQPIGGELRNACLGRIPIELVASFNGDDLATGDANDVGRDILVVRAEPREGCFVGLFTVHFKSGETNVDFFRRAVESKRLVQAVVQKYRPVRPDDGIVLLGDFNEQHDAAALGLEFTAPPAGLPDSYFVGDDIEFPLVYDPFADMAGAGFERVEAFWEDSPESYTHQGGYQIDYVLLGDVDLVAAEVYNSSRDNGEDDEPPGGFMEKLGEPLSLGTSSAASDHLAVVADITLP